MTGECFLTKATCIRSFQIDEENLLTSESTDSKYFIVLLFLLLKKHLSGDVVQHSNKNGVQIPEYHRDISLFTFLGIGPMVQSTGLEIVISLLKCRALKQNPTLLNLAFPLLHRKQKQT